MEAYVRPLCHQGCQSETTPDSSSLRELVLARFVSVSSLPNHRYPFLDNWVVTPPITHLLTVYRAAAPAEPPSQDIEPWMVLNKSMGDRLES